MACGSKRKDKVVSSAMEPMIDYTFIGIPAHRLNRFLSGLLNHKHTLYIGQLMIPIQLPCGGRE